MYLVSNLAACANVVCLLACSCGGCVEICRRELLFVLCSDSDQVSNAVALTRNRFCDGKHPDVLILQGSPRL